MRPQQRFYLLKHHLVPKLMYSLVLGRVDKTEIDLMDKRIRVSLRSWLKLLNDVSKAHLYADETDGGANVPILSILVSFSPPGEKGFATERQAHPILDQPR